MNVKLLDSLIMGPALRMLPMMMDSPEARLMLAAIALQESGLRFRKQIRGPARGWWQFEEIAVREVAQHRSSTKHYHTTCELLEFDAHTKMMHEAIAYNDTMAFVIARLFLWRVPEALPAVGDEDGAWRQYVRTWRPGKPHPQRWPALYQRAMVELGLTS